MTIFRLLPRGNHVNQLLVVFISLSCLFIFVIYVTDDFTVFEKNFNTNTK